MTTKKKRRNPPDDTKRNRDATRAMIDRLKARIVKLEKGGAELRMSISEWRTVVNGIRKSLEKK